MLTPDIYRGRMAPAFASGFENGVRRLYAPRFFKLTQIVPCGQQNDLLRVNDNDAVHISVVA